MNDKLTPKDWDEIYALVEEYYIEHSKLVTRLITKLSHLEDQQGQFLMMCNERNSVYGRMDE